MTEQQIVREYVKYRDQYRDYVQKATAADDAAGALLNQAKEAYLAGDISSFNTLMTHYTWKIEARDHYSNRADYFRKNADVYYKNAASYYRQPHRVYRGYNPQRGNY